MKKLNLAITLVAFILLLASCQQQNDVGRYIPYSQTFEKGYIVIVDTKTGELFVKNGESWNSITEPVRP